MKKKSVARKKRAPKESLRDQLSGAWECLDMVRETLQGMGTDMNSTPPMFYPEAITGTVWRYCRMVQSGELVYNAEHKSFVRADGALLSGSPR